MQEADLLLGTLDMLILKALRREPIHGFGIASVSINSPAKF
jgi:hypothetical protein